MARDPGRAMSGVAQLSEEIVTFRGLLDHENARRVGPEPAWLAARRRAAWERFEAQGLPTPQDETWRYTRVAHVAGAAFRPAPASYPRATAETLVADATFGAAGPRIVFVNGRHAPELGSNGVKPGVELGRLHDTLADEHLRLEPVLGRHVGERAGSFAALNEAFLDDGVVVLIQADAKIAEPIHVVFVTLTDGEPIVTHPRCLVVAGHGASATIVEAHVGAGTYLSNAVTEVVLEDGATVQHVRLQRESTLGAQVATVGVTPAHDAVYRAFVLAAGGALSRLDQRVRLAGEGASCELNGLFLAKTGQHQDVHVHVDHARPHGTSRQLFKGIVDGAGRGVFHGSVLVRPGAQQTDAQQTNRNLLLSKEALVNSTPGLEIFADDVKCKHGSTTGRLDDGALFYLRARGIGEAEARAMLTWAFASDVVAKVPVAALRDGLDDLVHAFLPAPVEVLP